MAIIRAKRERCFTVINNNIFADGCLSFAAMGLLTYLLSKPDDWEIHVNALVKVTAGAAKKSGRDAIYSLLNELISAGFVKRYKRPSGEMDYFVYDEPQEQTESNLDNQDTAKSGKSVIGENPNTENATYGKPVIGKIRNTENPDVLIRTDSTQRTEKRNKELNCAAKNRDTTPEDFIETKTEILPAEKENKSAKPNQANLDTWESYKKAYLQAYGVEPLRNAKVNKQIADFVKTVGAEKAPSVAAFYVFHPNHWYRTKGHDVGTLLANAQAIVTDWQRKTVTTSIAARQQEQTASNYLAAQEVLAMRRAKQQKSENQA